MKILVTGGAGFIGSHLVKALLDLDYSVITLDDLSTGRKSFLQEFENHKNHEFVEGTVLDKQLLSKLIDQCDAVFHLAAVLGVKNTVENPLKVINGNIEGTKNVLECAYSKNIKVVFASTSEVYGKNTQLPFDENSSRVLGPTTTHRWCYATAKALDEHLCFAYAQMGLPVTVVRYFNAYGPRAISSQYGGVVPKFITAALKNQPITVFGTGNQTRCFTYIDDMVKGTILCLDSKHNNEVFNIGMNERISINELANQIKRLCKSNSPIVHVPYEKAYGIGYEDTPDRIPDNTKAKTKLNFSPAISTNEGLIKTIEWYRQEISKGMK